MYNKYFCFLIRANSLRRNDVIRYFQILSIKRKSHSMNLTDYLLYTKSQLTNLDQFQTIRIVLGNESSDLDSTISACIYAYFLYLTCSNRENIFYIPLINTSPSIFRLRTEIRWFLKDNFNNVSFLNDIDLNQLSNQNKLEIILVDHHYLRSKFNKNVIEIIDHHQIKKNAIVLHDSSAIRIEPVGSCCTLVAEKILSTGFKLTEEMAYLLSGPIVFDTVNFSPKVGKTTPKDEQIFAKLQTFCQSPIDSSKLYADLEKSSADTTGLSIADILQKDVKQVIGSNLRLILSSLPMNYSVEKLINELKTMNDLNEFLAKNENADGVIMTSIEINDKETKRQLGYYLKNVENFQSIDSYFQTNNIHLDLHERSLPINQARLKYFDQNNIRLSRKQILPFVEEFLNK